jgi:DNA-binding MarR family transcriptional regulator
MEEEGLLPSELAEKTAQDRAAITGVLDRLEKEGWLERHHDTRDRRSWRIHLTDQARAHKEAILSLFEKINRMYLARFSQEEWRAMQEYLNRLEY